jgi:hypothetical protein
MRTEAESEDRARIEATSKVQDVEAWQGGGSTKGLEC